MIFGKLLSGRVVVDSSWKSESDGQEMRARMRALLFGLFGSVLMW